MKKIGILSDTHISTSTNSFERDNRLAFADCDVINHAGDLVDVSILKSFGAREVYAVHGNMCSHVTRMALPERRTVVLDGYLFAVSHGAGPRHNIEERVFNLFPEADCIIYGHTHTPVCHTIGKTLLLNPGSFMGTGTYGSSGTYGLVHIDDKGLHGSIHTLPRQGGTRGRQR